MSQVVSAESKRAALLVATLSSFLTPFAGSSVNIALPTIGQQLAMDAVSLSWVAMAPGFLLSLYLQYVRGLSPQTAGLVMVSQPLVQAILSPLAGRLSDRIEPRIVASLGMMVTTVGLAWFILLEAGTDMTLIVANLVLLGLGFALFSSPNTNAIMRSVEKRFYGVASATLATMRLTGQMFSMGIATLIIGTYVGHVEIVPASYPLLVQSTKAAFVVFAVLCAAGVFASLTRGDVQAEAVGGGGVSGGPG